MKNFFKIIGIALAAVFGAIVLAIVITAIKGEFGEKDIKIETLKWETEQNKVVVDDFYANILCTPQDATNKEVNIKITKGNNVVEIPQKVTAGVPFEIKLKKVDGNNVGGVVEIYASTDLAISEKLTFYVDVEIPLNGLEIVSDNINYESTAGGKSFTIYVQTNPKNAIHPFTGETIELLNAYKNISLTSSNTNDLIVSKIGEGELYYCENHTNPAFSCKPYYTKEELAEGGLCPSCLQTKPYLRKFISFKATPVSTKEASVILKAQVLRTYAMQQDFKPFENILEIIESGSTSVDVNKLLDDYSNFLEKYKDYIISDNRKVYDDENRVKYESGQDFVNKLSVDGKIKIDSETKVRDSLNYVFVDTTKEILITEIEIEDLISNYTGIYKFSLNPNESFTQKTVSEIVEEFKLDVTTVDGQKIEEEALNNLFKTMEIQIGRYDENRDFVLDNSIVSVEKTNVSGNVLFNFNVKKPAVNGEQIFMRFVINTEDKTFTTKDIELQVEYNEITGMNFVVGNQISQGNNNTLYTGMNLNSSIGLGNESRTKTLSSKDYINLDAENDKPSYSAVKFFITQDSAGVGGYYKLKVNTQPKTLVNFADSSQKISAYELPQSNFTFDESINKYVSEVTLEALNICDGTPAKMFAVVLQTDAKGNPVKDDLGNLVYVSKTDKNVDINIANYVDKMYYYTVHENNGEKVYTNRNVDGGEALKLISKNEFSLFATNVELNSKGEPVIPNSSDNGTWAGKVDYINNLRYAFEKAFKPAELQENIYANFSITGNEDKEYVTIKQDSGNINQTDTYGYYDDINVFSINNGTETSYPVAQIKLQANYANVGLETLQFSFKSDAYNKYIPSHIAESAKVQSLIVIKNANFELNADGTVMMPTINIGDLTYDTYNQNAVDIPEISLVSSVVGNTIQWKIENDGVVTNNTFSFNGDNLNVNFTLLEYVEDGVLKTMLDSAYTSMENSIIDAIKSDKTKTIKYIKWSVENGKSKFAEFDINNNLIIKKGTVDGESVKIYYTVYLYQQPDSTETNLSYEKQLDGCFVIKLKQNNIETNFVNTDDTQNTEINRSEFAGGKSYVLWQSASNDNLINLKLNNSDAMGAAKVSVPESGGLYFLNENNEMIYEINEIEKSLTVYASATATSKDTYITITDPFGTKYTYFVSIIASINIQKPEGELELTYGEKINLLNEFSVTDKIEQSKTYPIYFEIVAEKKYAKLTYLDAKGSEIAEEINETNVNLIKEINLEVACVNTEDKQIALKLYFYNDKVKQVYDETFYVKAKKYMDVALEKYNDNNISKENPVVVTLGSKIDLYDYIVANKSGSTSDVINKDEIKNLIQFKYDLNNYTEEAKTVLKEVLGVENLTETISGGVITTKHNVSNKGVFKINVELKNLLNNNFSSVESLSDLTLYISFVKNVNFNINFADGGSGTDKDPIELQTNKLEIDNITIQNTNYSIYDSSNLSQSIVTISSTEQDNKVDYINTYATKNSVVLKQLNNGKYEIIENSNVVSLDVLENSNGVGLAHIYLNVLSSVNSTLKYKLEITIQNTTFEIFFEIVKSFESTTNYPFSLSSNETSGLNYENAELNVPINFEENFLNNYPRILYSYNGEKYLFNNNVLVNIKNNSEITIDRNNENFNKIIAVYEVNNNIVNYNNNLISNSNLLELTNNNKIITFKQNYGTNNFVVVYKGFNGAEVEYKINLLTTSSVKYSFSLKNDNKSDNSESNPQEFYAETNINFINKSNSGTYINCLNDGAISNNNLVVKYVSSYNAETKQPVENTVFRNGDSKILKEYEDVYNNIMFRCVSSNAVIVKFAVCATNTCKIQDVKYYFVKIVPDITLSQTKTEVYAPGGTILINSSNRASDYIKVTKKTNTNEYIDINKIDISIVNDESGQAKIEEKDGNIVLNAGAVNGVKKIQFKVAVTLSENSDSIEYGNYELKIIPNIEATENISGSKITAPVAGQTLKVYFEKSFASGVENPTILYTFTSRELDYKPVNEPTITYKVDDVENIDGYITVNSINYEKTYRIEIIVTFDGGVVYTIEKSLILTPNTSGINQNYINYEKTNESSVTKMDVYSGTEIALNYALSDSKTTLLSQINTNNSITNSISVNAATQNPLIVINENEIDSNYFELVKEGDRLTAIRFKLPYNSDINESVVLPFYVDFTSTLSETNKILVVSDASNYYKNEYTKFEFNVIDNLNTILFKADSALNSEQEFNLFVNNNSEDNTTSKNYIDLNDYIDANAYVQNHANANLLSNIKVLNEDGGILLKEIEVLNVIENGKEVTRLVFNGSSKGETYEIRIATSDYDTSDNKTSKDLTFKIKIEATYFEIKDELKEINVNKSKDGIYSITSDVASIEDNKLKISVDNLIDYGYDYVEDGAMDSDKVELNKNYIITTSSIAEISNGYILVDLDKINGYSNIIMQAGNIQTIFKVVINNQ